MEEAKKIITEWIALNNPDHILKLNNLGLTELPDIPANCRVLFVEYNELTSLPNLDNCIELGCGHNNLTVLPDLPNCIALFCENNKLTELPKLPNCARLDCDYNKLTVLPELPLCWELNCDGNQLSELPKLPECISLCCGHNMLTYLPQLHRELSELYTKHNKYLYVNKKVLKTKYQFLPDLEIDNVDDAPNYNYYARIIQRNYKKHLRMRYVNTLQGYLLRDPSKIVSTYVCH
jgi:Leucine-rich repeat (LRR) protein